jgi:hypothetical protein
MQRPLKEAVDRAAARNNRSINAEIHARLEASFVEERALGGPEMHWLVTLVVAAFTTAAQMQARGDPNWASNPDARRAGIFTAIDSLLALLPDTTPQDLMVEIEGLKSRLLTREMHKRIQEEEKR